MNTDHAPADWPALKVLLAASPRIWITTHQNPDGDGLGAELALWGGLRSLGAEVRIINPDPLPSRYAFLGEKVPFEAYDPGIHGAFLQGTDVAVLLDAARPSRVGALETAYRNAPARACIDHHPPVPGDIFSWYLADTTAAATGQLVYEGLKDMGWSGDPASALGAYVALVTDTGSFRFSNSDSRAHALAAELLLFPEINPAEVFDLVFGNWELPRLRLLGHVFTEAVVRDEGRVIVMPVSRSLLKSVGAGPEDTEGLVDLARNVGHCELVACLVEQESDVRISLRSKGRVDVSALAKTLGGGGHPYASGARMKGTLDEVTGHVSDLLVAGLEQSEARAG